MINIENDLRALLVELVNECMEEWRFAPDPKEAPALINALAYLDPTGGWSDAN